MGPTRAAFPVWLFLLVGAAAAAGCRSTPGKRVIVQVTLHAEAPRPDYLLVDWFAPDRPIFIDRRVPETGALTSRGAVLATIQIETESPRTEPRILVVRGMQQNVLLVMAEVRLDPSDRDTERVQVVLDRPATGGDPDGGAPPPDAGAPPDRPDAGTALDRAADPAPGPDARPDAGAPDARLPPPCDPGTCKRVFLTSRPMPSGNFGGLGAGDGMCQALADGRGLGGTWRAWLSDGEDSPLSRFTQAQIPHRLLTGTTIATSFADLIDNRLAAPIDVFETGERAGSVREVWTGTAPSGEATSTHCGRWTDGSAAATGTSGMSNDTGARWTAAYRMFCSRADYHLYCFEQ
jgi:hypothetical protein